LLIAIDSIARRSSSSASFSPSSSSSSSTHFRNLYRSRFTFKDTFHKFVVTTVYIQSWNNAAQSQFELLETFLLSSTEMNPSVNALTSMNLLSTFQFHAVKQTTNNQPTKYIRSGNQTSLSNLASSQKFSTRALSLKSGVFYVTSNTWSNNVFLRPLSAKERRTKTKQCK